MTEQQADDNIIARGGDPGPLKMTIAEAAAHNNTSSTEDVIIDSPSVIECEFMASFDHCGAVQGLLRRLRPNPDRCILAAETTPARRMLLGRPNQ